MPPLIELQLLGQIAAEYEPGTVPSRDLIESLGSLVYVVRVDYGLMLEDVGVGNPMGGRFFPDPRHGHDSQFNRFSVARHESAGFVVIICEVTSEMGSSQIGNKSAGF